MKLNIKEEIEKLYNSGLTYREINNQAGYSNNTIAKVVKNLPLHRDASAANKLTRTKGRGILSDAGRQVLSENGKRACLKTKKCWTTPERKFRDILRELGIGVKIPEYIKEIFDIKDDDPNGEIFFQFPLQRYVCDFVDETRKIIYLVNGDFWHGNPLLYSKDNLTPIQINNIRHDENRDIFLRKLGYQLFVIWESEINWNSELVKEKIRATRKTVNPPELHSGHTAFDSLVAQLDWSEKLKKLWFKPKKLPVEKIEKSCLMCGKKILLFKRLENKTKFCSLECGCLYRRKVTRPNKEELEKMLWEKPTAIIAKEYEISESAVRKWAKQYNLQKPPRGYWQKLKIYKDILC